MEEELLAALMRDESAEGRTLEGAILDALPAAVMVFAPNRRAKYANAQAARVFAVAAERLTEGTQWWESLGLARRADDQRTECTIELQDGRERRIGLTRASVGGDTVVVFRDISELTEIRAERDRLLSLAAIGEALPSFVHELKNTLAGVTTLTEVMLEELSEGDTRDQLHDVLTELRRMRLNFDGVEAVRRGLRSERSHAIDYAVRAVCRVLAPRAESVGVTLRCLVEDIPLLPLDSSAVRAIVLNFVTNAIHACGRSGTVAVYARLVQGGSAWELVVSDNGVGMTPEVLSRSTELFFTTKASGSGIGLALCHRLIHGAGGTLQLRSVPGFGTSVLARVPIDDQEE